MRRLRDILPKGLYWRTLLIILAPAALVQLIVSIVFLDDHWRLTSKRMSQGVAGDIGLLIELYERSPTPETFADLQRLAKQRLVLDIEIEPGAALEKRRCNQALSVIDRYFRSALEGAVTRPVWFDATCPGRTVEIRVPIEDGVLRIFARRDRVQAQSGPLFVLWVFGATMFLGVVSILFIRNQVRPIETLAAAMNEFGRGVDRGIFKARGAREVREATHAFFDMRARIRRHIEQRAMLLAGVSHDLRTPLTRLKLQFALMPPSPELADAKADLEEMEHTLDEYLAFARGESGDEPELLDLAGLIQEVAEAARRSGGDVSAAIEAAPVLAVRPRSLRRALHNLIDNAVAHGTRTQVSLIRQGPWALISVDDDGPGIPEHLYEDAFRPFSRLDETRTRNAKGVGLGLAIARDVARAHGGDVLLSASPLGGLRAALRLPMGDA